MIRNRKLSLAKQQRREFIGQMPGIDVKMVIRPEMYFSRAYAGRPFEPRAVNFLKRSVTPGMTVLDIGANVGFFTLFFARRVGAAGRVYAFEPGEYACGLLQRNIALNNFSNVTVIRKAVGDRCGKVCLHEGPEGFDVYSSLRQVVYPQTEGIVFKEKQVDQITVDEFMDLNRLSSVDVVKVDVEGGELSVFRGMRRLLARNSSCKIIFELGGEMCNAFGYSSKDVVRELESFGYRCWGLGDRGQLTGVRWEEVWPTEPVVALK